jgi:hypothetical protein
LRLEDRLAPAVISGRVVTDANHNFQADPPDPPPPPPPALTPTEPLATDVLTVRPTHYTAVGAGAGHAPEVVLYDAGGKEVRRFLAFDPGFLGGVRVATGDLNGDGVDDVVAAAGAGGGPHVKVFDGLTGALLMSFFAYGPDFTGGVFVAVGDVNGDGAADIVTGAGAGGGPHVKAFDGRTGAVEQSFFAFDPAFAGGVAVAADVGQIVTGAGPGGGPHVKVFDGRTLELRASFFAYDPAFTGGVTVAAAGGQIVTGAGPGGGSLVEVFGLAVSDPLGGPASSLLFTALLERQFAAFDAGFAGGVTVAARDVNGDNIDDVIAGAGPGGGPQVSVFDGSTGAALQSFFAFDPAFLGGVAVG